VVASENSKAGRSRSGVSLAADIHCIVLLWDVLQDRISGFIREFGTLLKQLNQTGGATVTNGHAARWSQRHRQVVIEYDWIHS
jgi:hypothetical protein